MRSTFLPFSPPDISEDEVRVVANVLRSGWPTTGAQTRRFEQEFAAAVDAPAALAVSSCTDAMLVSLAALGIKSGDTVATTPLTFCATAHVIQHLGAKPLFVDVETDTLNISPRALEQALARQKIAAIMPVHLYGHPCDMDAILALAGRHHCAVVEDAAHAFPAKIRGRHVGSFSAAGGVRGAACFSFYATKNITTVEGGMITGNEDFIAEARLWSLHGIDRDTWQRQNGGSSWGYQVVRPGFKCNMPDTAAALGLAQLQRIDSMQKRRRQIVAQYHDAFAEVLELQVPAERGEVEHAWHLYALRLRPERLRWKPAQAQREFIAELKRRNIGASVHFIPLHQQPFYRDTYGLRDEDFPVTTREAQRLVSLPLFTQMTDADVRDVIVAVLDTVKQNRR
jgi:dTDP-4-amino-4,6-dideoxygalactose transaminase